MKKGKRYLAIMLTAVMLSGIGMQKIPVKAASPLHILALGDSIAQGYGLEYPDSQAYSAVLAARTESVVQNEGINGLKSGELLEKLRDGEYDSAIEESDIIVLSIGSNDILKPCVITVAKAFGIDAKYSEIYSEVQKKFQNQKVDVLEFLRNLSTAKEELRDNPEILEACAAFEKNFEEIIGDIRQKNPYAVIYADNIYNPYNFVDYSYGPIEVMDLYELTEPYIRKLNETFESDAKEYTVINTYLLFQEDGYTNVAPASLSQLKYANLDPHPNAEGHFEIANLIYEKMDRIPPILEAYGEEKNLILRADEKVRMVEGKALWVKSKEEEYEYRMSGAESVVPQEDGSWKITIPLETFSPGGELSDGYYEVSLEEGAVKDMGNNSAEEGEIGTLKILSEVRVWFYAAVIFIMLLLLLAGIRFLIVRRKR